MKKVTPLHPKLLMIFKRGMKAAGTFITLKRYSDDNLFLQSAFHVTSLVKFLDRQPPIKGS